MNKRIGLTGGIGAGKSTVCDRLLQLGAGVLFADAASREVVEPGTQGLKMLQARYGQGILAPDGTLARRALAAIIFADEKEKRFVEALLHPLIQKRLEAQARAYCTLHPGMPLFLEIPLLIETGMHTDMDAVWLVTAPLKARIARIAKRDGLTAQEALARVSSQMPQEEKLAYADVVLQNDGDIQALLQQVDACYSALTGESV